MLDAPVGRGGRRGEDVYPSGGLRKRFVVDLQRVPPLCLQFAVDVRCRGFRIHHGGGEFEDNRVGGSPSWFSSHAAASKPLPEKRLIRDTSRSRMKELSVLSNGAQ